MHERDKWPKIVRIGVISLLWKERDEGMPPSSVGERYDPLRLVRLRAEGGADALSSSCAGAIVPVLLESERSQGVQRGDRLVAVH